MVDREALKGEGHLAPFVQFALAAAAEALEEANWSPTSAKLKALTGVSIGAGIGSIADIDETLQILANRGHRRITPRFIPKILINMASGEVSIKHGFTGPNVASVTACATGTHAIADAFRLIALGDADVMVAGGSESCIHPLAVAGALFALTFLLFISHIHCVHMAGFSRLRALSTGFNDQPEAASRPFDKDRDGFVIGEGAGMLVLEEEQHARDRGAHILAELRGYGLSSDAHHVTAPSPQGGGAVQAMDAALRVAGLAPLHVDYINAHATSTPLGDAAEVGAISKLFGRGGSSSSNEGAEERSSSSPLLVSSTKGATGHLLGAAGAVEAVYSVLAVSEDMVPPSLNLGCADHEHHEGGTNATEDGAAAEPPTEVPFEFVREGRRATVNAAMTNSFGFGGTNASLVFAKHGDGTQHSVPSRLDSSTANALR
jgi:3-oxoacyl-[acyl-carrier-protein] synthase II